MTASGSSRRSRREVVTTTLPFRRVASDRLPLPITSAALGTWTLDPSQRGRDPSTGYARVASALAPVLEHRLVRWSHPRVLPFCACCRRNVGETRRFKTVGIMTNRGTVNHILPAEDPLCDTCNDAQPIVLDERGIRRCPHGVRSVG
jgi:hypothetical protein